jgi:hypothetical protein
VFEVRDVASAHAPCCPNQHGSSNSSCRLRGRQLDDQQPFLQNVRGGRLGQHGARYILLKYLRRATPAMSTLARVGISLHTMRHYLPLGKTMIAQNIAHAAVLAGHTVLFRSAAALLEELHRQSPEGRRRKLRGYANVGLLCIDEVGYLSFDDKAADLLYEVVNRRYERKPVILTTNRPFKEWNEVFPNATCIVTLLDRLLHHADVTAIEGDSYRMRESEQETAARRRKK